MVELEISVDDLSLLGSALPGLRGSAYDSGVLLIPDDAADEILEMVDNLPSYRAGAFTKLKAYLKKQVDAAAESERMKYITGGAGQALTYQRKVEEARAASVDSNPTQENYPLLSASIGIDGSDIASVANVILSMDAAWSQACAAIESVRLGAKRAIDDAEDANAAQSAFDAIQWPA